MAKSKYKRKLTAILSADVVGYSRLMGDDEEFTIQTLNTYRDLMTTLIEDYSGSVVDAVGDNLLAEFTSVVDAVQCAVTIQTKLKKQNDKLAVSHHMLFRIGINVGDIIQEKGRIYGDGVNIAARIEGVAEPGGICISRNTYDHVKDKLELGFEFLGEHEVKNIKEPVRVYKILQDSYQPGPLVNEFLELSDKPSIAVLPFDNMSGDPSQEYFSDGLTEQIINGLCKIPHLFVIARNSSFAYRGKSFNIKQIAQELGVKYILEGSVQKVGDRVRITAQLIDAATDYHMWSKRYDRDLIDIFALQDEITMQLICAMTINLTAGEQARLWTTDKPSNIESYDKCSRGNDCLFRYNEKDNKQARLFLKEAINLDSSWAWPYILLGFTHIIDLFYGWSGSPLQSFEKAEENAKKAITLNDSLDQVHCLLSCIYLLQRQYDKAIKEGERAIDLNPNGAAAYAHLGMIFYFSGKIKSAIRFLKRAFRLDPTPPPHYYYSLATAYLLNGEYKKAIELAKKVIKVNSDQTVGPNVTLVMAYSLLNRPKEVGKTVEEILKTNPNFSLEYLANRMPFKHQETVDKIIDTLRKAGLPE